MPNNAAIARSRANAYNGKGDRSHAIADFERLIRAEPTNAKLLNDLATVYLANGERDRALVDYDQAIGRFLRGTFRR